MNKQTAILFCISFVLVAILAFTLRQCLNVSPFPAMSENTVKISRKIETLQKPVHIAPVEIEKNDATIQIKWKTQKISIADSAEIRRLTAISDSLRRIIAAKGASVVFSLDTITNTHDTVHVDCDETNKAIRLGFFPAPRMVTTERETITITQHEMRRFGIGLNAGYSFSIDGGRVLARPAISIGFNYTIY